MTLTQNLSVVFQYLLLTLFMTLFIFLKKNTSRHLKTGSWSIFFAIAYSYNLIGLMYFTFFIGFHSIEPSTDSTKISQPCVVFLGFSCQLRPISYPLDMGIACAFFPLSIISLNISYCFTSASYMP